MPATPLSINFSDEAKHWLQAALEETLSKERESMEQRLAHDIDERVRTAVEREVGRQVEELRAVADIAAQRALREGPSHAGGSGSLTVSQPHTETTASIQRRLKQLGDVGGRWVMSYPHEFNKFRLEHGVSLYKLSAAGGLELLPDKAPRADQIFFVVPDPKTEYFGLFLGYEVRAQAEAIRAVAPRFREDFAPWFDITITGLGLNLLQPAVLHRSEDGNFTVALKGRIDV